MSFAYHTALDLARMIREKEISPVELVEDTLTRQEALEPALNCFVTRTPEVALAAAKRAEQAVFNGDDLGSLHGLPLSECAPVAKGGVQAP